MGVARSGEPLMIGSSTAHTIGALIIRIGFPLKGSLKGSIRDL